MQNTSSTLEAPQGQTYLAVIREMPGFRFYLNPSGELTKYPCYARKFESFDAALDAICEADLGSEASGVALLNSRYQPSGDEPMVWPTERAVISLTQLTIGQFVLVDLIGIGCDVNVQIIGIDGDNVHLTNQQMQDAGWGYIEIAASAVRPVEVTPLSQKSVCATCGDEGDCPDCCSTCPPNSSQCRCTDSVSAQEGEPAELSNETATHRPYTRPHYEQFAREVEEAGHEVTHYRGRFFYEGPAVVVSDVQDAIRATSVKVQWDNLGKDFIVYPQ